MDQCNIINKGNNNITEQSYKGKVKTNYAPVIKWVITMAWNIDFVCIRYEFYTISMPIRLLVFLVILVSRKMHFTMYLCAKGIDFASMQDFDLILELFRECGIFVLFFVVVAFHDLFFILFIQQCDNRKLIVILLFLL